MAFIRGSFLSNAQILDYRTKYWMCKCPEQRRLILPHREAWTGVRSSASVLEVTAIGLIRVRVRLANGSPYVAPFPYS